MYTIKAKAVINDRAREIVNNSQLINQDSGNTEYYTPRVIIESAREVMGSIDLDPASCKIANQIVKADKFFTINDNGLDQLWFGNVWMNHPFSKEGNKLWINKLVSEFKYGAVSQAMCITYASTSEQWFRPLFDYPICFLYPRTNYILPDGSTKTGSTKGSCVVYLGKNLFTFAGEFSKFGSVMWKV